MKLNWESFLQGISSFIWSIIGIVAVEKGVSTSQCLKSRFLRFYTPRSLCAPEVIRVHTELLQIHAEMQLGDFGPHGHN